MPIKEVYYYSGFKKSAKKYREYQELIKKKIKIFLQDPFNKSLKSVEKITKGGKSFYRFEETADR